MENRKKKYAIWIDNNINSIDNKKIFEELEIALFYFEIYKCKSVKEAFELIKNNYNRFQFKLIYIILNEELCEAFIKKYMENSLKFHFITATVIFSSKFDETLFKKPFFSDPFLNHGKIVYSVNSLLNYIKWVQCPYYLNDGNFPDSNQEIKQRNYLSNDITIDAQFIYMSKSEMAYPIIIAKFLQSNIINKNDLEDFQKNFIRLYPELKHLIKPSEEKDIFIPYNFLAKYYLHLYTVESNFYRNLNKELSQGKFNKYRQYIFILYNALNKGFFKSCSDCKLYRGGTLSDEEYKFLKDNFNNSSDDKKVCFFSKKFLSFSKKKEVSDDFLKNAIRNKYKGVYIRIIVNEQNNNFYSTNIDINKMNLSKFSDEEEVLFLPLSCFEVISIHNEVFFENEIKIIKLKYLNQYEEEIYSKYKNLLNDSNRNEKEIDDFIKNGLNCDFFEEISKCLGIKINKNWKFDYLKKKKFNKNIIDKILESEILGIIGNKVINIASSEYTQSLGKHIVESIFKSLCENIAKKLGTNPIFVLAGFILTLFGIGFGKSLYEKIENEKICEKEYLKNIMFYNDKKFYCENLYYGYLPEKYRKKYFPSLKWNNELTDVKSMAIELIIDENYDNPNYLIINIPGDCFEINEFSQKGDIIIHYNGIPENAFSAYFGLYMFDKDEIDLEYFKKIKHGIINDDEHINNLSFYTILKVI